MSVPTTQRHRIRKRIVLLGSAFLLLYPRISAATLGGPTLVEVLGFDQVDRKVYYALVNHDGFEEAPRVFYFALAAKDPTKPVLVESWYEGEKQPDRASIWRKMQELRGRLIPLQRSSSDSLCIRVESRATGKVARQGAHPTDPLVEQYDLRVAVSSGNASAELRLTSYDNGISLVDWRRIPGESPLLAVISHRGKSLEGGYEVQTVALLEPAQRD